LGDGITTVLGSGSSKAQGRQRRQRQESKEGKADEHITVDRRVQLRSRRIDRLNRDIHIYHNTTDNYHQYARVNPGQPLSSANLAVQRHAGTLDR
jgi:hypothetical protein